jgi:proline iminopeptidase
MEMRAFEVGVDGGTLVGEVGGEGPPVLVLHGGPGLSGSYVRELLPELLPGHEVAWYQQRGLAPSSAGGPYGVAQEVSDVAAVLDGLGWDRAVVVGHSWGGHLLLHAIVSIPQRISAAVVVDTLGGVGDGGEDEFDEEMAARTPADVRARAAEMDAAALRGEGTEADASEAFRMFWPAYFADPATAPPPPDDVRISLPAYAGTFDSIRAELPALAGRLAGAAVPTVFVHGGESPMPLSASTDSAAAIGAAARVVVVEGAGHFPWYERPGAVRSALDALLRDAP